VEGFGIINGKQIAGFAPGDPVEPNANAFKKIALCKYACPSG
jgi:hypothetical protein